MQSLRELYKIGRGPSSSHTMGPERAVKVMLERYPQAEAFRVTLYGSLASTGVGHGTDRVVRETFLPVPCDIQFDHTTPCPIHPNTMDIEVIVKGETVETKRVYSVGGGSIVFEGENSGDLSADMRDDVYELNTYAEIADYCHKNNLRIWQYVEEREGREIFEYLSRAWEQMKRTIHEGLTTTGVLPGVLGTQRRAQILYNQKHIDESAQTRENRLVCSYAFAEPGIELVVLRHGERTACVYLEGRLVHIRAPRSSGNQSRAAQCGPPAQSRRSSQSAPCREHAPHPGGCNPADACSA